MSDAGTPEQRGVKGLLSRISRGSPKIGTTDTPTSPHDAEAAIDALGDAGGQARALDRAVEASLGSFGGLSELTSDLALRYLDRIRGPVSSLTLEAGVTLVTRGYAAHQAVEAGPGAYGAGPEVPILGTLPDLHKGRPPQDLLTRVVKATRRAFPGIRAVPGDVWEGFVVATTERTQAAETAPRVLDRTVVDGLLRFGWVLRQVDLRYEQGPPSPAAVEEG